MTIAVPISPAAKVKIILFRNLFNITVQLSNIILLWPHQHSNRLLWAGKNAQKFLHFAAALYTKGFNKIRKLLGWNNDRIKSSSNEPIGNKEGRQVIWQRTPINIISLAYFHQKRVESGKDNRLSVAYLQSLKTSRGSYVDPDLSIFVKYHNYIQAPVSWSISLL